MQASKLLIELASVALTFSGLGLIWQQSSRLSSEPSFRERVVRALAAGVGVLIAGFAGTVMISFFALPAGSAQWDLGALRALICIVIPIAMLSTLGLFIRFSTARPIRRNFSRRLDEIVQKAKKKE